jgi:hypothetical protein
MRTVVSLAIKTNRYDITEILLKIVWNAKNLTLIFFNLELQIYVILNSILLIFVHTCTVPEMNGRQMRLISYSGDQKLLQIR